MESSYQKPFLTGIKSKVIAAFVLTCLAIALAFGTTYYSFRGLLETVDQLSTPNGKLQILHNLFQRVTQLDQLQRAEAIRNPGKRNMDFLQETKTLLLTIDTLKALEWRDTLQPKRLAAMEKVLKDRDKLFLSYLKVRSDFIDNRNFTHQLDSLSGIISKSQVKDTSIKTTTQKTVTTTYKPQEESKDSRSFLGRLFGKKKETNPVDSRVEVNEEISVQIDTVAVAQQESAIKEVGHIMQSMEHDQRLESKNMVSRELQLITTNNALISQVLNILHQVEEEELVLMHTNNENAVQLVGSSIKRIGLIMLVFLLVAAVLVFFILTDITKGNYYRQQLIQAKEDAEQLSQVKQRFLANMSHEIRTPLQTILGFTEQLSTHSGSANADAVKAIHSSSEHLLHIVNEVLDYSRIESGKFTLVQEPFYLMELVEDVTAGMKTQASKKNLSFVLDAPLPNDIYVKGDAFRLKQILYNLLGNAIKFTNAGSVTLHIDVIDNADSINCIFKISDTGIGIRMEDLHRVFQQFEQVSGTTSHLHGGAGLGLSIVKTLVELQQGTIHVESEFGKGSSFTVKLPYDKQEEDTSTQPSVLIEATPTSFKGKVMLVDDDPLIVKLCSLILDKHHIPYIAFQESEKALHYDIQDEISLILLDIRMPNISGVELCKALRKKVKPATRIVALTAHVLPHEKQSLLEEGFDEVLTKPFREQQLLALIGIMPSTENKNTDLSADLSFTTLKQMTMGDEDLFQSIVKQFVDETDRDVIKLDNNLSIMTTADIREIVHKLSGRTAQMGIKNLSDQFRFIENQLHENRPAEEWDKNLSEVLLQMKNVLDQVREEIIS